MLLSNQFCGSGSKLVQYSATLSIRIRIRIPNTDTDPQIGANFRILNSNITGKLCFITISSAQSATKKASLPQ